MCPVCGTEPIIDDETMCNTCSRMISTVRRKQATEVGSGNIRTFLEDGEGELGDGVRRGRWVQMDQRDEWAFLGRTSSPTIDYHLPGEREMTDIDLFMRSFYLTRAIMRRKWGTPQQEDIEEVASEAYTLFLEAIAEGKEIENAMAYHTACCRIAVRKWGTSRAQAHLATLTPELIDWAEANGFRPVAYGTTMPIEEQPQRERVHHKGVSYYFDEAKLTKRERTAFINCITGRNEGLKSTANVRRLIRKAAQKLTAVVEGGEDVMAAFKEAME